MGSYDGDKWASSRRQGRFRDSAKRRTPSPEAPWAGSVRLVQQDLGVPTGRWVELWFLTGKGGGIVVRSNGYGNEVRSWRSWREPGKKRVMARLVRIITGRTRPHWGVEYVYADPAAGVLLWKFPTTMSAEKMF